jgi:hypothetical protein
MEDVEAQLLAREPLFHRPELGRTRADLLAQTARDYWEVGASGAVHSRELVIETVLARGAVAGEEDWVVSEPRCRPLGDGTYALTYRLDQAGRVTRRLTLWRRTPDGWQALYHQGTPVSPAGP